MSELENAVQCREFAVYRFNVLLDEVQAYLQHAGFGELDQIRRTVGFRYTRAEIQASLQALNAQERRFGYALPRT